MKVSILSPCYNVEKYISQCLDSIIQQTYKNLQIILVDDGSTDNTLAILNQYASLDSRIEVHHQENKGVATARNELLSKVKGDYVLFVDSDDWIELDMVEFLITKVTEENAEMAVCGNVVNNGIPKKNYKEETWGKEKVIEEFLRHTNFNGSLCNKLFNVKLLKNNPTFNPEISYGEDALFTWQIIQDVEKIIVTDKQLYHYRMNEGSLSHGKFGDKKLSGHTVWTKICEDTEKLYPNKITIARARFCIEATLLLRNAAHDNYKDINNIKMLQQTIQKSWHFLNKVDFAGIKMKAYAFIACRSYWFANKF